MDQQDGSHTKDSPAALRVIQAVASRFKEQQGGPAPEARAPALTEKGNGERFAQQHGQEVRYCADWGKWLVWKSNCWREDNTGEVMRRAKQTGEQILDEKILGIDFKALQAHWLRTQERSALNAMLGLAQSEFPIPVTPNDFDRDPWLLNCANGTINLQTMEFKEPCREDLLMKATPVIYDPEAIAPSWITFLMRIMDQDQELIAFLQRAIGYSLTAMTSERALFILYGTGRNGKTTLLETLHALCGDYGITTPTETLLAKDRNAIPNDIARLRGARFVSASETEEGPKLGIGKIKALTGGDTISARFMRGEYFEFVPTFKLWLATNHKPAIKESNQAIWDRIKLIPFTVRISDREEDRELKNILKGELSGILNWALAGLRSWLERGLGTTEKVVAATREYQAEQDQIGTFLEECCVLQDSTFCLKSDLYRAYHNWCKDSNEHARTKKVLGLRLVENGFRADHQRDGRRWLGIGLRETLAGPPSEERVRQGAERVAEESDLFK